ncbi:hypothetical protein ILUMI_07212 [Ignelater luminosus]|uniref:Mitochondrial assembly of ribosomal large subunit protein 1 n=1 Tax=Ignelater luminosus TaxID=2038154 RepID=A0A8K0GH22_IGNLU|nr:hypothetical protein ILUMI_07212 [Ignelater luminosus]
MLSRHVLNKITRFPTYYNVTRKLCEKKQKSDFKEQSNHTLGDIGSKYKTFRDEDSEIIFDVVEERKKYASMLEETVVQDPFEGLNLERGKTGVFDIDDLVTVLKRENAEDIFVAAVPPEFKYVDYICVVSGKSQRHMSAITQFVRRVYKQKRRASDIIPILEGAQSKDWMALDLGNIALHIFSKQARSLYDVDSLWAVGPKYDDESVKQDPVVAMLEKHSIYLKDLQPAT